jgi:hypothetical protein
MNKDYFQDIMPSHDEPKKYAPEVPEHDEQLAEPETAMPPERSIRNINVSRNRPPDRREVPPVGGGFPIRRQGFRLVWVGVAAIIIALLCGIGVLLAFRKTTITVIPRTHTVVFDSAKTFTASAQAAEGGLSYAAGAFDVQDSAVVQAVGSAYAERKASGSITVVNEFSTQPVNLVKNTRFETPEGLIYRALSDIKIPGMSTGKPGAVSVTVVADQAGTQYNIGPVAKFTLPGLKGGAMAAKVYASSANAFSGGFAGNEPSVAASTRDAAVSEMRGRMQEAIKNKMLEIPAEGYVFPNFAKVTYAEAPPATEADGQVRLRQTAHVEVPVFSKRQLFAMIGGAVSADAEGADLSLIPKEGFSAQLIQPSSSEALNFSDPIVFSISGTGVLLWNVDTAALAGALSGKDKGAFQTIVKGFPGVQDARARIEPFWRGTFPSDASDVVIEVEGVANAKSQ